MGIVNVQVDAYLSSCYSSQRDDSEMMLYWSGNATKWRKLAEVAKRLLSAPASSTSSERSFSLAGQTMADRRSRLSAESVDGLLFLHGLKP